jgi:phosphomannomutase
MKNYWQIFQLTPLIPVPEQQYPDPDFPTVKFPNPEEGKSSLVLSMQLAKETDCNIILANDPDADRLACAELDERYISICLIIMYLFFCSFYGQQYKSVESFYWKRTWCPVRMVVIGMF